MRKMDFITSKIIFHYYLRVPTFIVRFLRTYNLLVSITVIFLNTNYFIKDISKKKANIYTEIK